MYKVTHEAKTYTASAPHKEGMLNWWQTVWNRKPVFEKRAVFARPIVSVCHNDACPVGDYIVPLLCPGRKKFLTPPLDRWKQEAGLGIAIRIPGSRSNYPIP